MFWNERMRKFNFARVSDKALADASVKNLVVGSNSGHYDEHRWYQGHITQHITFTGLLKPHCIFFHRSKREQKNHFELNNICTHPAPCNVYNIYIYIMFSTGD